MPRTAHTTDLPLRLDRFEHGSLPVRIAAAMRDLVASGTLQPGQAVPSTRALADSLGTSRGSVVAAYEQLTAEGYLESARGSGTIISPGLDFLPRPPRRLASTQTPGSTTQRTTGTFRTARPQLSSTPGASSTPIDMRPGASRGITVPTPQWRAAWRWAASQSVATPDLLGEPWLRTALADRWRRVRAVGADAESLVVTSGARDGLALILRTVRAHRQVPHATPLRVAFEDPGYPSLRQLPVLTGDEVVPAPTDDAGIDPARLPENLDVVIVTPSHQYPSGGSLPLERRLALIAAARERNFLIVEDEHTAEWRWAGAPLPALSGLDAESGQGKVTAMVSSMSSLIHPGVGAGFVALPPELMDHALGVRELTGAPVSVTAQLSLADFMTRGALDRHLNSARSAHRKALGLLTATFARHELFTLHPVPGGLQAVVTVNAAHISEAEVVAAARSAGATVTGLSDYWLGSHHSAAPGPGGANGHDGLSGVLPGFVLGFGMDTQRLEAGLQRVIAGIVSRVSSD